MLEDHSQKPVPDGDRKPWYRIAMVFIGGIIALPILLTGFLIGGQAGFQTTVLASLIGGAVVAAVAVPSSRIGADTNLSSYLIAQFAFGRRGAQLIAGVIAVTILGWVGVNLGVVGTSLNALLSAGVGLTLPVWQWTVIAGALMTITAMFGFDGLDKLSLVSVPLLALLLIVATYTALTTTSPYSILQSSGDMGVGQAISLVIGSVIVGAVIKPDITRYAKTPWDATKAVAFGHILMLIVLLAASSVLAVTAQSEKFTEIMRSFGLALPAFVVLALAAWTTNDNNLYSTSLGLTTIFESVEKWQIVIIAGTLSTVFGALGILSQFKLWLTVLTIGIPPVVGIYTTDYYLRRDAYTADNLDSLPSWKAIPLLIWAAASTLAWLTTEVSSGGFGLMTLTSIPALDAILAASFLHLVQHNLS